MADCGMHLLKHGENEIRYILTRKNVKNVNMRIKPDGLVYISANNRVSLKFIEEFIHDKSGYIINALDKYKTMNANGAICTGCYKDGGIITFLGNSYTLKVVTSDKNSVSAANGDIYVNTQNPENINKLIDSWFRQTAEELFERLNRETYCKFSAYGISRAEIQLRNMKSRWGSCHYKKGKIVINTKLICCPAECIEYVFYHEYAHFIVPNHSKRFYEVLESVIADYKLREKKLKGFTIA